MKTTFKSLSRSKVIKFFLYFFLGINLAVFISLFFEEILNFTVINLDFGWVFTTIALRLLVMVFFAIGLTAILKLVVNTKRVKLWIFAFIGAVTGFLLCFAINPIYDIDYFFLGDDLKIEEFEGLEKASNMSYQRTDKYEVLAFLDVGCEHCQVVCQKLGINQAAGQTIPTHLFFADDSLNVNRFIQKFGGENLIHHQLDNESSFVNYAGFQFPSIFLINSAGQTEYHWIGERLNYTALDYLLFLEQ